MKNKLTLITTSFFLNVIIALPLASFAQLGSLDLSFDTDGKVTTSIGMSNDMGNSVAIQPDGKIIVVGSSQDSIGYHSTLVRYNTNGNLDNTFDSDGIVHTSIGISSETLFSVALQSDGKIVVAGLSYNVGHANFAVARYNTNGSLDSTFDLDGKVITPIGNFASGHSLVIQADGKILLGGYIDNGSNNISALVRYNANGILDSTFDTDGIVTTSLGAYNYAYSIAIQNDGKIVQVGYAYVGSHVHLATFRYNTNGSLDNTFDTDGKVTTQIGVSDKGYSVAIQPDGKIVVAGASFNGINDDFVLVRYNTDGSLDNSLDSDGIVTTPIGTSDDVGFSVVIQSDGKIIVGGYSINGSSNNDFAIAKYNTNGSLDTNFDTDGIVTTPIGTSSDYGLSLAIQGDGKIIVAGYSDNGSSNDFALARYNNTINLGIIETENQSAEINIYPNPFSILTTLYSYNSLKDASLTFYNILGQPITQLNNLFGKYITLSRDNLSSGLYFILIVQENKIISRNKLVITD